MENHSPTPWFYEWTGNLIGSAKKRFVADVYSGDLPADERIANARHIVKCVNSHEALVAALANLTRRIEYLMKSDGYKAIVCGDDWISPILSDVLKQAEEAYALAAAEEE